MRLVLFLLKLHVTDEPKYRIGEVIIYDWGNGAASEAYNRIIDHYGEASVKEN